MDPHSAATGTPDPDAIEFVRFCYRRRRVGWPELYDEMCAVVGRGLFRGYNADDLAEAEKAVKLAGGVITQPPFTFPGGRRFHFREPGGNELAVWSET